MLKSFIYNSRILSTCINNYNTHNIIKRTFFNTAFLNYSQLKVQEEKNNNTVSHSYSKLIPKNGQKRARQTWTKEEDQLLKELIDLYGHKYSLIATKFPNRRVASVYNRCQLLFNDVEKRGPWSKEELTALKNLTASAGPMEDQIDWETIQKKLPQPRSLSHIKLTWDNKFNPRWHRGRWQQYEIDALKNAVQLFNKMAGNDNNNESSHMDWRRVSDIVGTRSPNQCLERWRWQESPKLKGPYTRQEDLQILEAVKKYGDQNFLLICNAIGSSRSPRHLSQRYRYALDPNVDRSEWTSEEEMEVYNLLPKYQGSMLQLKKATNSRRSVKDMWNHYKKMVYAHNGVDPRYTDSTAKKN